MAGLYLKIQRNVIKMKQLPETHYCQSHSLAMFTQLVKAVRKKTVQEKTVVDW
jgi:hypothetical protein